MGLLKLFRKKRKAVDGNHTDSEPDEKVKADRAQNLGRHRSVSSDSDSLKRSSGKPAKTKKRTAKVMKKPAKKAKKKRKASKERKPRDVFPRQSISALARALNGDEWERLAYALGFLAQAVSHFTGRASSSQNTYSQACLMLRTWRDQMPVDEILPRLSDALQRIRRHDLALKVGLELGVIAPSNLEMDESGSTPEIRSILKTLAGNRSGAPYYESRLIVSDERISFLARQILAKEEWKRLAYAIGFLPDEVAHIIATASSSQNLYAQAHLMLMIWRLRTPPNEVVPRLKAGFVRIRRLDLVDLLRIGAIAGSDDMAELLDNELKHAAPKQDSFGASIAKTFTALQA